MTTTFKVRNNRNPDGTYTLSYGKGKAKVTATMTKGPDGWWFDGPVAPSSTFPTMKACKEAWEPVARKAYGDEPESCSASAAPQAGPPSRPAPPRRTPPPSRPGPPRRQPPSRPGPPTRDAGAIHHDPFDSALEYPPDHPCESLRRRTTPLGALDQVYTWMMRNTARVQHPRTGSLAPPWDAVQAALQRHVPKPHRYNAFPGDIDHAQAQAPQRPEAEADADQPAGPPRRKLSREGFDAARDRSPLGANDYDPAEDDIPF